MVNRKGKVEAVTDFIFLGHKITMDSDHSHEVKRRLLLERKSYDRPRQCIKKQRHHIVKAIVFPTVTYGYEIWTIKKTENRRIDAFGLWCS